MKDPGKKIKQPSKKQKEHPVVDETGISYKTLFDQSPDGIVISDAEGKILEFNEAAHCQLGYTRKEFSGLSIADIDAVESPSEIRTHIKQILKEGKAEFEVIHRTKQGERRNVQVITKAIGQSIIHSIWRDITEHKRMENEMLFQSKELNRHREQLEELVRQRTMTLKKSEAKFRQLSQEFHTLLDAIPDSLLLVSPDLRVLWANRGAAEGLGRAETDLKGRPCYELWFGRCEPCDNCYALRSFESGNADGAIVVTSNGRMSDVRSFPIKDEDGKVNNVIIVGLDITEKTALQAEAVRASHLASLGELAAGVAHEINNPINGIINYAQILVNESSAEGRGKDIAGRILKEGGRIAGIVSNLLSFARDKKEGKEPAHVNRLLADTLSLSGNKMFCEGIRLKVLIPQDLPRILANPSQVQQIFLNIINNAAYALNLKYPGKDEEKKLEITAEEVGCDDKVYVRTIFQDNGPGIPESIIDKVLSPFFSTKPGGEGTGLGLSISHGIVKDHGGSLKIQSREGEYTRVIIDFPAYIQ